MADPVALPVLGGVAATEGIKFLYGQAAELLKAWRDRRRSGTGGASPAPVTVPPIVDNGVLDGAPTQSTADLSVLDREVKSLVQLVGSLAPYAEGIADIDLADQELGEQAGRVRALLEAVYGQRFTFRGEQRDVTGTRVSVRQVLGDVEGWVVGAEAEVGPGGDVSVDQGVSAVKASGTVIGSKGRIES